ncbi:MAG TPA: aldo/keto reductase [Dehalococcoidia bacterium]|nr:aldo/keto reductase [Dehalococcoidia bacterium]
MKQVPFAATDLTVSNLCLGTMQFGWTADEAASFEVMDAYVAAAGNFIDTADIYSRWAPGNPGGVSEEIIGRWMKARGNRGDLVIATKVRGQMWDGPDGEGLSRSHIERAVEDSLRRLQVDTIDLYQTHWPDEGTPIEETLTVFGELIDSGKVRYIGLSNYPTGTMREALRVADEKGLPRFVSLQPHYNLAWREEYERSKAAFCAENDIAVIPYSPLEGGFLTGKYRRGQEAPKSARAGGVQRFLTDDGFAVINALDEISSAKGVTIAAVALAWLLTKPAVVSPIIGANSLAQLADLLPASELSLTMDEVAALDTVSERFTIPMNR